MHLKPFQTFSLFEVDYIFSPFEMSSFELKESQIDKGIVLWIVALL